MTKKKTLVLGASDNPARYSYLAINKLRQYGHPVIAIGRKETRVADVPVTKALIPFTDIHSITLYMNPFHQKEFYSYILSLQPKRIIFNPGTENDELDRLANEKGIETIEACTLVMLGTGQY